MPPTDQSMFKPTRTKIARARYATSYIPDDLDWWLEQSGAKSA